MYKGTTSTGFEYSINESVITDWRFVSAMAEAESDDASKRINGTVNLIKLLLGDDEQRMMDHVKQEDGSIPFDAINREIVDMLQEIKESKKK